MPGNDNKRPKMEPSMEAPDQEALARPRSHGLG
jgi:hypothetical protein